MSVAPLRPREEAPLEMTTLPPSSPGLLEAPPTRATSPPGDAWPEPPITTARPEDPFKAWPAATTTSPTAPLTESPERMVILPEFPDAPPEAEKTDTPPEEPRTEAPEAIITSPPIPVELAPPASFTAPPAPSMADPAFNVTSPPAPAPPSSMRPEPAPAVSVIPPPSPPVGESPSPADIATPLPIEPGTARGAVPAVSWTSPVDTTAKRDGESSRENVAVERAECPETLKLPPPRMGSAVTTRLPATRLVI
jgi:hypothetical protein